MPRNPIPWSRILLIGFFVTLALPIVWERTGNSLKVYTVVSKLVRGNPIFERTETVYTEDSFYSNWSAPLQIVNRLIQNKNKSPQNSDSEESSATTTMTKTPVFFISHGGPNVMFETEHEAYGKLQAIGREITQKIKPKAIIVVSAHWEGEPNVIEVNTAETMPLIYDFYGFPPEYYSVAFPNKGSPELAERVISLLEKSNIKAEGVRRGLDHGAWASFHVAFNPDTNPVGVPIVQVSLFDSDDPEKQYALGAALEPLREEGVQIVCSGMAVHNLRDMFRAMGQPGALPYTHSFDDALKEAVEQPSDSRRRAMTELLKRPDARRAHPSFDHLFPVHVAAGAAGKDVGKQIWTKKEGSMSWAQYRFDAAAVAA